MTFDVDSALLWELAQDSAQEVAVIAAGLIMKESQDLARNRWKMPLIKRLGKLAGYLQFVSFDRDKYETQDTASQRVEELLQGLELLCTVSFHILSCATYAFFSDWSNVVPVASQSRITLE